MKNKVLKIFASIFVVVAMMLTTINVYAAVNGTITINKSGSSLSFKDVTFTIYQIADVTYAQDSGSSDGQPHSYTILDKFNDLEFKNEKGQAILDSIAEELNDSEDMKSFAKTVYDFIQNSDPKIVDSGTTTPDNEVENVTFNNLTEGYYLVTASRTGGNTSVTDKANANFTAFYGLVTTDPDGTINLKADTPAVEKNVKEKGEDDSSYGDWTDAEIGETVTFKLTGTIPNYTSGYTDYTYIFHDKLSNGLTLDVNSIKVYSDDTLTNLVPVENYTVKTTLENEHCTLEVEIEDAYVKDNGGKSVYVVYDATVNKDAEIHDESNPNEVYIEYSNNPYDTSNPTEETTNKEVEVYTYKFGLHKFAKYHDTNWLAGAEFKLYRAYGENTNQCSDEVKLVQVDSEDRTYRALDKTETGEGATIVTDSVGNITIKGLDAGTYYLDEIKAPDGYNKLKKPIKVIITATENTTNGKIDVIVNDDGHNREDGIVLIENNTGTELPETGGIGTTIFYITGSAMVLGAIVLFVRKKQSADKM